MHYTSLGLRWRRTNGREFEALARVWVADPADVQGVVWAAEVDSGADCLFQAQGRLQEWQAAEHEASDRVHCDGVSQGQDLAAQDQAQ